MSETAPPACEVPSHLSGASLGRVSKLDSGSGVGRHKYGSSHVCFSKAHREAGRSACSAWAHAVSAGPSADSPLPTGGRSGSQGRIRPGPCGGVFNEKRNVKWCRFLTPERYQLLGCFKTSEIGPACRREHDFRVSPASRKKLDLGVILGVIL